MISDSHHDHHTAENSRLQNAANVDFQCAPNQANFSPVRSASATVCVEPRTQAEYTAEDIVRQRARHLNQAGVGRSQTTDNGGHYVHTAEKQRINLPSDYVADDYLKPATTAGPKYEAYVKENVECREEVALSKHNPRRNEENEEHLNINRGAVTNEFTHSGIAEDDLSIVILHANTMSEARRNVDRAGEATAAMPVYDNIYEDKNSDAREDEHSDRILYNKELSVASSISHGELIDDTSNTDLINAVEATTAERTCEVNISDARRRKSIQKSSFSMPSSYAATVSRGEVVDNCDDIDLFETDGQSLVHIATDIADSETIDQPLLEPGN